MYPIFDIANGAAVTTEPLGTKYKFWYRDPRFDLTLFKEGRPNTGENWAEKIACELAEALGLPHARYELATYEGRAGVLSPTLVERGARIVHGNELLASFTTDYLPASGQKRYGNPNHTLRRVVAYLKSSADSVGAPYSAPGSNNLGTALDYFIGYLMLDAWIANQDRHDENWGVLRANDGNLYLAPTYDHGSSMGRNLTDHERSIRLVTKDLPRHISQFVLQARSGLFAHVVGSKPRTLYTLDAFQQAAQHNPAAAQYWRDKLLAIADGQVEEVVSGIPDAWMSDVARRFTIELLRLNRLRILGLFAK